MTRETVGRTRVTRRVVLVVAVAVAWASGSALLASPALAGEVNGFGYLNGALYNATPYTMTKVAQQSLATCYSNSNGNEYPYQSKATGDCWDVSPADTLASGGATGYTVFPNYVSDQGSPFYAFGYDAYVTYRVNVVGGPPEYVTFTLSQCDCSLTRGNSYPTLGVWNTTAPPPVSYDPGSNANAPATQTAHPQITYAHNTPDLFDQWFQISGAYTTDAASNQGQALGDLLNSWCSGAPSTKCSFTQTGPLTWGVGTAVKQGQAVNCTVPATGSRDAPSATGVGEAPPPQPPVLDPNWFSVAYDATQSATLTIGGSVTAATEVNLFNTVAAKISVEIAAEHEWQEVKKLTRSSTVYLASNNIGSIWVAPVVGKVTGTLVVSSGAATYTITNFAETRSGVSKDPLTPAFNVITQIQPMSAAQFKANCGNSSSRTLARGAPKGAAGAHPPLTRVKRGQTRAEVLRELGRPLVERFTTKTCRAGDVRCNAVGGRGGTWVYRDGWVVFGANHRVSALIETTRGRLRTVKA